jgi:hypothetical protein
LLSRLTDSTEPPQPVPRPEEKVETQPVDSQPYEQEQDKKNILDKLVGGGQESDKSQAGDPGDA